MERTVLFSAGAIAASTNTAQELQLTEDLPADATITFEYYRTTTGSRAYNEFESNDLMAKVAQSANPFTGQMGECLGLKMHNPGDTNFGHESCFFWLSDESDKVWFKTGRDVAVTLNIFAHKLVTTLEVTERDIEITTGGG